MQRPEKIDDLSREGQQMRLAGLHAFCENAPVGGVEVEFLPLGLTGLPGTHTYIGWQPQRIRDARLTGVSVNCAEEFPDPRWLRDRREVTAGNRRQRTTQVSGAIAPAEAVLESPEFRAAATDEP